MSWLKCVHSILITNISFISPLIPCLKIIIILYFFFKIIFLTGQCITVNSETFPRTVFSQIAYLLR